MTLPIEPEKRHCIQAQHNNDLLNQNCFSNVTPHSSQDYNDWLVTISFYTALHHIYTYLWQNKYETRFDNHFDRNEYLKELAGTNKQIKNILQKYLTLYKLSRMCRYLPCHFNYITAIKANEYYTFSTSDLPKELGV